MSLLEWRIPFIRAPRWLCRFLGHKVPKTMLDQMTFNATCMRCGKELK